MDLALDAPAKDV